MGGDEGWKGEHLISAKGENRRKEATRMANLIHHANRRKQGAPPAGGKKHKQFMNEVLLQITKGKT